MSDTKKDTTQLLSSLSPSHSTTEQKICIPVAAVSPSLVVTKASPTKDLHSVGSNEIDPVVLPPNQSHRDMFASSIRVARRHFIWCVLFLTIMMTSFFFCGVWGSKHANICAVFTFYTIDTTSSSSLFWPRSFVIFVFLFSVAINFDIASDFKRAEQKQTKKHQSGTQISHQQPIHKEGL